MRLESLHTLYVERLRDMRDAEDQIIKALPKMIERVQHLELRTALERHLGETRQQAARLEQIFDDLDESPTGKKCKGIAGILEEADELSSEKGDPSVIDAGIIDAAQHVEHYEIAGYGTLCTFAGLLGYDQQEMLLETSLSGLLGYDQQQMLLETSLNEEKKADDTLTDLAELSINVDSLRVREREVRRAVEADGSGVDRERPERRPLFGQEERRF